ncbi:MAG: hypothetical protein ACR2PS_06685 [Pseudomonadales bacterium]
MSKSMSSVAAAVCALSFGLLSNFASAAVFWVVEGGDPASANAGRTSLDVTADVASLDLYFDTEDDTSFGWNLDLDVTGTGTISNVTGAFVSAADGVTRPNGGWKQIGGDDAGETGSEILIMSFDFIGEEGATISLSGSYTDGNFLDAAVAATQLVQVAPIPVPAAAWLFGSALLGLIVRRKTR